MASAPQVGGSGGSGAQTYVGADAVSHSMCRQIISPELNVVVSELLTRIKGFQERAMARDAVKVRCTFSRVFRVLYGTDHLTIFTLRHPCKSLNERDVWLWCGVVWCGVAV